MKQAINRGDVAAVLKLVKADPRALHLDIDGKNPLQFAVQEGQTAVVETFFRLIPSQFTCDHRGRTLLHLAIEFGRLSVAEMLVRLVKDIIDARDVEACTPLHCAARRGDVEAVRTLVRLGCAIDPTNKFGQTPLHFAAAEGNIDSIEALLRLGSGALDGLDHAGWTPLFHATVAKKPDAIETLIRLGSKGINTPSQIGWTPLLYSTYVANPCTAVLQALGAELSSGLPLQEYLARLKPLDEDYVLDVRFRTYFVNSLVYRLLFCLDVMRPLILRLQSTPTSSLLES